MILANAVLQWVPDHDTLFPNLIAKLDMGGTLAVQVPNNAAEPAHTAIHETASGGPWAPGSGRRGRWSSRHCTPSSHTTACR